MAVAISFNAFAESFREFTRIAKDRSNPLELDANPLSEVERKVFLRRVNEL